MLLGWRAVSRQRRSLRELTDEQLADIGLSRRQAEREAERYCWDHAQVPAGKRKVPPEATIAPAWRK